MRPGDLLEQRYRLVRVLGRGRSGSVWCARNELIDRAVAVKILHRSLASDPERLQRFFQEARACGRVRHPAVVEVLDLGQGDDGILFLVMELLEGETMASLLGRKGRLSVDEALALVIPLAHGLAAAHAHGILHRDLKPANIYLHKTPTGGLQPKILDFGISKIIGNDVTATGVVLGTPSYMSPEQARGVPDLDARTDVWSLGVILYEALTGRLPFIAKEYRALVDEIIDKRHVPVAQLVPEIPAEVARVVDEALDKSRDRRMPSAGQMAQRLTAILRSRGRAELVREGEDEFSEGAPTLTHDRDLLLKPPESIDDTVGDAEPLMAVRMPEPAIPTSTKPGVGLARTSAGLGVDPSPSTQAIAALASGAKRLEKTAPRPAAGAPARPSKPEMPVAAKILERPEETHPDPLPLVNRIDQSPRPEPEPARVGGTQSWEVSAAKAASGRAEVILAGPSRIPTMQVDEDWDTTVADVSAQDLEKGPLPKLAPPPVMTEPPPAKKAEGRTITRALEKSPATITSDQRPAGRRSVPPNEAPRKTLGSIPGFTAAPNTPPPMSVAPAGPAINGPSLNRTQSAPPPPLAARISSEQAVPSKRPPRPPPKTIPPGNGASGHTLRPPAEGYAVPASPGVQEGGRVSRPPPPPSSRRPSTSPPQRPAAPQHDAGSLLAPELYALGDQRIEQPFELVPPTRPATPASLAAEAAPESNGHGPPVVLPATNPNIETDRHRRSASSLVPMIAAAVVLLFVFGAGIGAVVARSGKSEPHVRRFTAMSVLLVAWHDQAVRVAAAETKKAEESAKQESMAAKPQPPEPPPTPSASAPEPEKSAAPEKSAPPVAPKPVATAKPKPLPVSKPKPVTTAKPKAAPEPTTKKKSTGDKEWWQKKF